MKKSSGGTSAEEAVKVVQVSRAKSEVQDVDSGKLLPFGIASWAARVHEST